MSALRPRIEAAGIAYPGNWDDLGSSAKDMWEERMMPSVEKFEARQVAQEPLSTRIYDALMGAGKRALADEYVTSTQIPCDITDKPTAADAWWWLYHARCELERDVEIETGICTSCGETMNDGGDHDDDTEEADELSALALKLADAGVVRMAYPNTDQPMIYAVSHTDGVWRASYGPDATPRS